MISVPACPAMYKLSKVVALFVGALAISLLLDFTMLKLNDNWIVGPLWTVLIILVFFTAAKLFQFSMDALASLLGNHHPSWMWVDNVTSVFLVILWLVTLYISVALVNGGFGGIL